MPIYDPKLIELLHSVKNVLITTHVHPDGDAAGSVLGLATSLRKNGSQVDIALSTPIGERFHFMFENEHVLSPEDVRDVYNAVIILDIGSEDRTGFHELLRKLNCPQINIDHHATNNGFADFDLVDIDASSTCEMVFHLILNAKLPIDQDVARNLYVGLLTDSRYFQNANVRPETFDAASALLSTGFDHQPIIKNLTQSRTELDLKVLGLALTTFSTRVNGKIAYTMIRSADLQKLGATERHAWSAGVFGYLISL